MKLLVFSDDWGRHPSSCQHLVRQLLPSHEVTWVNTIGMRPPKLDLITAKRGMEKIAGWMGKGASSEKKVASAEELGARDQNLKSSTSQRATSHSSCPSPEVIDAKMWPWMSRRWDRWLNQSLLSKQLQEAADGATAITTIPIVADLIGLLPVKSWVYYCVDDFSVWPGLDGKTLGRLEDELIEKVDRVVAVSENLVDSLARRGCDATLLTHGVDVEFWRSRRVTPTRTSDAATSTSGVSPTILFWGVVDRRMEADWVLALADELSEGRIVLAGPNQDPDARLIEHPRVELPGPLPFEDLPELAKQADVLIMPYADLPVTRAMQPLKLKEYLATGRPVVVSSLPATEGWGDFLAIARSQNEFVQFVCEFLRGAPSRTSTDTADLQRRLDAESWAAKASTFLKLFS